jgi:hypothetical protein
MSTRDSKWSFLSFCEPLQSVQYPDCKEDCMNLTLPVLSCSPEQFQRCYAGEVTGVHPAVLRRLRDKAWTLKAVSANVLTLIVNKNKTKQKAVGLNVLSRSLQLQEQ